MLYVRSKLFRALKQIKQLAGQTAIYGIPSIVGRILNYLLVPLYTRVLDQAEYGTVTLMYSFVAVVFIILTYGMETAFFRYSEVNRNKKSVYSTGIISLFCTTLIFLIFVLSFNDSIASWIKYPGFGHYVTYLSIIISLDVMSALPFAKLRAENRAGRFARIKLINISTNIAFNLFFILLCPYVLNHSNSTTFKEMISFVYNPEISLINYIFISNLIASSITIVLLIPDLLKIEFKMDQLVWKNLLKYGWPLLFAGLAGIMNETMGRILLRYLLPESIAEQQLGIYSASFKIAILMSLFIQAFRYAAEPFFFSYAKNKDSKEVYALIMNYFVIAVSLIFLAIMLYIDVVILILGKDFREAVNVIPILLFAYMFLGVYYNLSVWFKLTNKTLYGAYMAFIGAAITIGFNFLLIPVMGYTGSAYTSLLCYSTMMIISFFFMRRFFRVKYNIFKVLFYLFFAFIIYSISLYVAPEIQWMKLSVNTILLLVFIITTWFIERKRIKEFVQK